MARKTTKKSDNSTLAGLIGFGATLLLYAVIFSLHKPSDFLLGGGLSLLAGWIVKTMATPLKGLDKNAKSKEKLNVTVIEDDYARAMVEKGVEMLDAFKAARDRINESVFTRRIDELRQNLDKVLRNVIEQPEEARYLRKINSYYLPTTLKLLESYQSTKSQGASYLAVSQTRQSVLDMLDKLNEALTRTLDTMLKNDLESMEIEIDVFDQMLKADGFAEDDAAARMRQSAHAAAREIPMSQAPAAKAAPSTQSAPTAPTLQMPATASARQLQQGASVLNVPDAPVAPDFTRELNEKHRN